MINFFKNRFHSANLNEIKTLRAKDVMIKPIVIKFNERSDVILKKLKREDINFCVVVDNNKKFLGTISDGDIIRLFLNQVRFEPLVKILNMGYNREFIYKNASEISKNKNLYINVDTPINDIIKLIYKKNFSYLPVLNKRKNVVGVVTTSSIIEILKKY